MLKPRSALLVAVLALTAATAPGQFGPSKYTSPEAHSSIQIAEKKITVDYYAPSMHGRKIMGQLVPFGIVWCTGANIATKLSTEAPLRIGDLDLPKGEYSIWTLPGDKEWTLIINKETGQFHLNYNAALDFGRTKMSLKKLAAPVETFRIDLRADSANKGTLALIWETTEASIPFTVR